MKLWTLVTGKYAGDTLMYELGGVFTTRQDAVANANAPHDAVWSTDTDVYYGPETTSPPDVCWPLQPTTDYCGRHCVNAHWDNPPED